MSKSTDAHGHPGRPDLILADLEAESRERIASTEQLGDLAALIAEAQAAQTEMDELKEQLAEASARYQRYAGDLLPSALDAAGVEAFRTADGLQVSIHPFYSATLARQRNEDEGEHGTRRKIALDYLRRTGNGGLIRNELTVTIPKGGDAAAQELQALAKLSGFVSVLEETVHPSTLLAFLREHVEGATDAERITLRATLEGLFRLSVFRRASIKPARG